MTELTKYETARRALAEARSVDEVIKIKDEAARLQAYAKHAKNRQLEDDARAIRMRAERRVGEMMAAQPKAKPPGKNQYVDRGTKNPEAPATLAEASIDKNLAKQARKMHALPQDEFEELVSRGSEKVKPARKTGPKPGEVQKQRSVNAEPEVWEQFKKKAEAQGKSPAAKLGELIKNEPQIDDISQDEIDRRIQERVEREFPAALKNRVDAEFTAYVEAAAARELEKKIAIAFPYYEQKIQVFDDWRANKAAITPQQLKIIDRAIREPEADARERALAILDDIVIRGRLCGDLRPASHGGRKRS